MSERVRCMWMRGGTSKGGYFLADDLPAGRADRDALLLRIMGSPDPRQIDGLGGGDPLTSKVAVVKRSQRPDVDVDFLFLHVFVDRPLVTDVQNCGNILAGVAPFAIERGLIAAADGRTAVRIFMENSGKAAVATVETPGGRVRYDGAARIAGVPGRAAAIPIAFADTAGATCGALLPTGRAVDIIDGLEATLIDNGMPTVILKAADLGLAGNEPPPALEADGPLRARIEAVRRQAGPMMALGDVAAKSVPKVTLVSAPHAEGAVTTRTFIPHRCHSAIGVLGAVSVATACLLADGPAARMARLPDGREKAVSIEHPTGEMTVIATLGDDGGIAHTAVLRTARKLFDGVVHG